MRIKPIVLDIETTGLDSLEDEIVAIGLKLNRKEERLFLRGHYIQDEGDLIFKFFKFLNSLEEEACFIGYNIMNFDLPFITARALKYKLPTNLIWNKYIVDLAQVVSKYMQTKKYNVKFSKICDFLKITRDNEHTGAMIPYFWAHYEYGKIKDHLRMDLAATWILFERIYDLCEIYLKEKYGIKQDIEWLL
jgi:uncharacterized protein YprB with RNaseH-like and TPR domain